MSVPSGSTRLPQCPLCRPNFTLSRAVTLTVGLVWAAGPARFVRAHQGPRSPASPVPSQKPLWTGPSRETTCSWPSCPASARCGPSTSSPSPSQWWYDCRNTHRYSLRFRIQKRICLLMKAINNKVLHWKEIQRFYSDHDVHKRNIDFNVGSSQNISSEQQISGALSRLYAKLAFLPKRQIWLQNRFFFTTIRWIVCRSEEEVNPR